MIEIEIRGVPDYTYIRVIEDGFLEWEGIFHPVILNWVRKIDL